MDPRTPEHDAPPGELISSLINEYFDRRQAGEGITPERFAAEHPDLVDRLQPYLAGLDLIENARAKAHAAPQSGEVAPTAREVPAVEGYEVIEEIGRGGMGVVYKARQLSTKRIVALKVMLAGPFASPIGRRRFQREVQLAARLQHPNIVHVLEGGHVAQQPYYAMDYVDGVTLDRYVSANRPDTPTTLALCVQVCEAVEYAHGHNVVHRDLKPANVLVDEEGHPYILDFGLAKATDSTDTDLTVSAGVSRSGEVVGTLAYLSPEQAAGTAAVDVRTDVYALGVMLFEVLTGSLPYDTSGRPSEVIQRVLESTPTNPSSLTDRVDTELETIILKALEKEKHHRYQSARELTDDIQRYLDGEPIFARRPSSLYFLRKKLFKHRWAAALATVAVALTLTGLLVESRSRRQKLAHARMTAVRTLDRLQREREGLLVGLAAAFRTQHPRLLEAHLLYAHAEYSDGYQEQAILELERDLQADPSRWAFRALLADIYRASGDPERADELQARVALDAPDTAEAWYLRSLATLDQQRALRCAEEAVQRRPTHILALSRLTYLRRQTGDSDGALRGADRLIELGKEPNVWILFKALTLSGQGRLREAVEQFTLVGAFQQRAHVYRRLKEYGKAVDDYTRILETQGETGAVIWVCYQRATPLWILGKTKEALADYRRVRRILGRPFYSDARSFLILMEQGRQREARTVLDAALRDVLDPWLYQIFRCLAGQISPDELIAEGIARDNLEQLCEAYYYSAETCLLSNKLAKAVRLFEKCVQTRLAFDPDSAPATPMNEYELAQWRLESLRKYPRVPPVSNRNLPADDTEKN